MTPRVAIIGAGLAGLTAARRLLQKNVEVVLIDKGHRGGGRMCTRKVECADGRTARFDLGPPLLYQRLRTDRTPPWYRVSDLATEVPGGELFHPCGIMRVGAAGEELGDQIVISGLAAQGGMRELPFRVLGAPNDALTYHDHTVAERLERTEGGWRVHLRSLRDGAESLQSANVLLVTPPVPQALELLHRNKIELPDELRDALRAVEYTRSVAVYGTFGGGESMMPGGVWFGDGPIEWIADNHLKGVSEVPHSITAHARHEWAAEHWADSDDELVRLLLPRVRGWVGDPTGPVGVQRWQWARPVNPVAAQCAVLRDLSAVIAGDGFYGAIPDPADAAVASGAAAAARIEGLLTQLARADDRYTVARPRRYALEVGVTTQAEAATALRAGADRLELSSALELGGLTPSMGLFEAVLARAGDVPVFVLIRPRSGGFVYAPSELAVMGDDIRAFLEAGAAGVVFGALTRDRRVDREACSRLLQFADNRAVFHRAFDLIDNQTEALEELIELGFVRVLTGGGRSTAEAGTAALATLVQHAGWQIEVLPAGDVRPHNVAELINCTRCDQVHSSARAPINEPDPALALSGRFVAGLGGRDELREELVAGLRHQLDRLIEDDDE